MRHSAMDAVSKKEIGVALIYEFCCKVLAELQRRVVAPL